MNLFLMAFFFFMSEVSPQINDRCLPHTYQRTELIIITQNVCKVLRNFIFRIVNARISLPFLALHILWRKKLKGAFRIKRLLFNWWFWSILHLSIQGLSSQSNSSHIFSPELAKHLATVNLPYLSIPLWRFEQKQLNIKMGSSSILIYSNL